MTIQKKLFITLLVGTTLTLGSPAPAHAGFLGNLLGGAAEVFVPGAGRAVNELTNEIDGTNDRLRQEALEQQRIEAQRQAEEQRLQLRREIEAQVRAEMEGQRTQTQTQPTAPRNTQAPKPTGGSTGTFARASRQAAERDCAQTTFSSAAFNACVRSRVNSYEALRGTQPGQVLERGFDAARDGLDAEGKALFDIMFSSPTQRR